MPSFPKIQSGIFEIVVLLNSLFAWIAVAGNVLFVWVFLSTRNRGVKTIPNYLHCAQCIPDIGLSCVIGVTSLITYLRKGLPGPAKSHFYHGMEVWQGPACTGEGFLLHVFVFTCGYTHVLATWERYQSIAHPLKKNIGFRKLRAFYLLIWVVGTLFASTAFAGGGFYLRPGRTNCTALLVPGPITASNVVMMFICANLILSGYLKMFQKIRGSFRSSQLQSNAMINTLKAEKRIAFQFFIIVSFFLFSCLPAVLVWFLGSTGLMGAPTSAIFIRIEVFGFLFTTSNCAINPFLYLALNKTLRKAFWGYFGFKRKDMHANAGSVPLTPLAKAVQIQVKTYITSGKSSVSLPLSHITKFKHHR